MGGRMNWDEIKSRQAARDPRSSEERKSDRAGVALRFEVAQLVYYLRTSADLTQGQLAGRMGTTQSVISRLEQAGRLPTLALLARLANATNVDLRLLATRADGSDVDVSLSA